MEKKPLRVMFLAAEADPLIKISGLGDVAGSLPIALQAVSEMGVASSPQMQVDIRLVIPFHGVMPRQSCPFKLLASIDVPSVSGPIRAEALTVEIKGVTIYLIAGAPMAADAPVYSRDAGVVGYKYTYFSIAALELARTLTGSPVLYTPMTGTRLQQSTPSVSVVSGVISIIAQLQFSGCTICLTWVQTLGLPWQSIASPGQCTGAARLEAVARQLARGYPERIRAVIRFDAALSYRIYGGADMLLIPTRYEPCGLTQMIAMRYGCMPVARAVGGLKDTIHDREAADGTNGCLFHGATPRQLAASLRRALQAYTNLTTWQALQRCGMQQDFSWSRFAQQYLQLYISVLRVQD